MLQMLRDSYFLLMHSLVYTPLGLVFINNIHKIDIAT
jgi:hypothetical protein